MFATLSPSTSKEIPSSLLEVSSASNQASSASSSSTCISTSAPSSSMFELIYNSKTLNPESGKVVLEVLMRISLMAGSGNGAAALARALDRVLQTASGPAAVSRLPHCAARQTVVISRKESVLLPKPWQACLRGFSDSNCGDSGPGKNDGELQNRRPDDIGGPAHPSGTPGGNLEGPQWANEPVARGGQSSAAVNGRRFASTPAIGFQKPPSSFGSAGISKAQHAFPNSEGPVDFGSRLSKLSEDDLDNLIAFKNFKGIRGLPPLETILAQDDEQEKRAKRREAERRKQEETKRSRVKQVDAFGRAYATGKRKTSIARVWLKEGQGDIIINGKSHDLYFLDMDKRVQLLEPFVITHTLGTFDVKSTVKGGGVSGQSGALRHGISKALQLFDPALRPALKSEGMLTRDDRIVERKKPGKAKARKSFQWVKR